MSYYITVPDVKYRQITIEDVLFDRDVVAGARYSTKTAKTNYIDTDFRKRFPLEHIVGLLNDFNNRNKALFEAERHSLYNQFRIPKAKGGWRQIDAPNDALKYALVDLKNIFEMNYMVLNHAAAYAYVKHRSTLDCAKFHQQNKSRWFLKIDFSNFFGTSSESFVISQLKKVYPYCLFFERKKNEAILRKALSLCFLDGVLPQGTPMSPMLTNLIMIPIDFELSRLFAYKTPHYLYTRYADDIIISCRYDFTYSKVIEEIKEVLKSFNAPYVIKPEKTRYGSNAGSNWVLGVLLNKDNEITIGHKKKKELKTILNCFMYDYKNGKAWDLSEVRHLAGLISYYTSIEGEKITHIIDSYSNKFGTPVEGVIKKLLGAEPMAKQHCIK